MVRRNMEDENERGEESSKSAPLPSSLVSIYGFILVKNLGRALSTYHIGFHHTPLL